MVTVQTSCLLLRKTNRSPIFGFPWSHMVVFWPDGQYRARIHDIRFDGLQHFVYRLTISAGPWVDAVFPLGGQRGAKTNVRLIGANLAADQVEYSIPNEADAAGPRVVRGTRTSAAPARNLKSTITSTPSGPRTSIMNPRP